MKFNYAIDPAEGIILLEFKGNCFLRDLLFGLKKVIEDPVYCRDFDGVMDVSEAVLHLSLQEFNFLTARILRRENSPRGDWGLWVGAPITTAWAILYQGRSQFVHGVSIFSTEEGEEAFLHEIKHRAYLFSPQVRN